MRWFASAARSVAVTTASSGSPCTDSAWVVSYRPGKHDGRLVDHGLTVPGNVLHVPDLESCDARGVGVGRRDLKATRPARKEHVGVEDRRELGWHVVDQVELNPLTVGVVARIIRQPGDRRQRALFGVDWDRNAHRHGVGAGGLCGQRRTDGCADTPVWPTTRSTRLAEAMKRAASSSVSRAVAARPSLRLRAPAPVTPVRRGG